MAWPAEPLDMAVEINTGTADSPTWTDITSDVYSRDKITVTRGQQDEAGDTAPATLSLTLNNRDGTYSPRNPASALYGTIGRNTPIRWRVNQGDVGAVLPGGAGDYIYITDTDDSIDIAGDIDIRIEAAFDNWGVGPSTSDNTEIVGRYLSSTTRSWIVMTHDGAPMLEWSPDGTTVVQATCGESLPVGAGGHIALRVTLDVDNGDSGWTVTFYISDSIGGTWTQLGAAVTGSGTTSIFSVDSELRVGDALAFVEFDRAAGRVQAVQVRSGIDGTVVVDADFSDATAGATSYTDAQSNEWLLHGDASFDAWRTRFVGEVPAWPSTWDTGGLDVWVPIEAAGIMRRLGQGRAPTLSALRRRIPSYDPLGYWPMEDEGDLITTFPSPIQGAHTAYFAGMTPAGTTGPAGSRSLPTLGASAVLGAVPRAPSGATTEWQVEFLLLVPDDSVLTDYTHGQFLRIHTTGTAQTWLLRMDKIALHVDVTEDDGTSLISDTWTPDLLFGDWIRFRVTAAQNGTTVDVDVDWTVVGGTSSTTSSSFTGTLGPVTGIGTNFGSMMSGSSMGHLAVFDTIDSSPFDDADKGYLKETAYARFGRLSIESGVPWRIPSATSAAVEMGVQPASSDYLALVRECATATDGLLFEDRGAGALALRSSASLVNQPSQVDIDYTGGVVVAPLAPVDDDQLLTNDMIVSQPDGASVEYIAADGPLGTSAPPDGVGLYQSSVSANLYATPVAGDLAAWLVHKGTWDAERYPRVVLALHNDPSIVEAASRIDVGDRVTITDLPAWLPPDAADLLVVGYREVVDQFTWTLELVCQPYGPWHVGVIADDVYDRADTGGSSLASAATSTATSLSVATDSGSAVWIDSATYSNEFPFDVRVGGEVVRVTAISGTSSPQTFTVTRSINGVSKAHAAGTALSLAYPTHIQYGEGTDE